MLAEGVVGLPLGELGAGWGEGLMRIQSETHCVLIKPICT